MSIETPTKGRGSVSKMTVSPMATAAARSGILVRIITPPLPPAAGHCFRFQGRCGSQRRAWENARSMGDGAGRRGTQRGRSAERARARLTGESVCAPGAIERRGRRVRQPARRRRRGIYVRDWPGGGVGSAVQRPHAADRRPLRLHPAAGRPRERPPARLPEARRLFF